MALDADDFRYMRGLVEAGEKAKLLVILDAAIEELESNEDDEEQMVDGHQACECGRAQHLCKTFNDPDADHGDA